MSAGWQRSVEPWYVAYALFSAVIGGLGPILLPQRVILEEGNPAHVGLVMSFVGLGGLTSAAWAEVANRFRCHRALFSGGLLAVALALVGFPIASDEVAWVALALVVGVASGAVNTMANLFVVESHGRDEWDTRIGWLQTFYNGGTVGGLLLAGAFSHLPLEEYLELDVGLFAGAAMAAGGAALGWLKTRTPPVSSIPHVAVRIPRPEWAHAVLDIHHPTPGSFRRLSSRLLSPFALFLAIWLVANVGPNAVYGLYPLLMEDVFGIVPGAASLIQALGFGLGLALYSPAGFLVHRGGGLRVLQAGLVGRLAGLLGLMVIGLAETAGLDWQAIVLFTIVTLTWPLLSVSSAVLVSRLSSLGAGAGMGVYNTASQFAGLLGPLLGGFAASWAGYNAVWVLGVGCVAAALALTLLLGRQREGT